MISRVLLLALLGAGFLPAQLNLFLVQNGKDVASNDQIYGFGAKPVGAAVTLEFHLRNTGADVTLTNIQLTSVDFQFIPSPPSVPQTVPAGTALDLVVKFSPSQPGPAAAALIANGAQLAMFTGTGLPSVAVSLADGTAVPSPLDFGSVQRGKAAAYTIVVTNGTGASVVVNVGTTNAAFTVKASRAAIPIGCRGAVIARNRLRPYGQRAATGQP